MEIKIGSDRQYPRNTRLRINKDTLEMEYSLNISEEFSKFLPQERIVKAKKFLVYVNRVKVKPITEENIEASYNYLKFNTMQQVRAAKLKLAKELNEKAQAKADQVGLSQLRMF